MKIFIPSHKRVEMLLDGTLSYIPENMLKDTIIVVRPDQYSDYSNRILRTSKYRNVPILAVEATGISSKRLQIAKYCQKHDYTHFIMMDDDLSFFKRKNPSTVELVKTKDEDMYNMVATMRRYLTHYSHVGISTRQGNNQLGVGSADVVVDQNARCIRAVAFRLKDYAACEIDRVNGMEDLDVSLQLLRKGLKNLNLGWWAQDQVMTNAPGGCSEWRTVEYHDANCKKLAQLHAPFVKLVDKENKTGGEFGIRTEVRIQWKAAYEDGRIRNVNSQRPNNQ